ncbi:hypothetical protein NCG89_09220 [Spongiibacter taiwanensis]|uniref:hypothetical protein n=1 Tax=Spongiibacter taiwanensis TaxID=1748242 RepID=UPI002035EE2A|nr:hypothetical protein [Spongiibacter taiwanensis]USA41699.1 hypothetical protein NCG89_09220 [Spongiibacter taiwanensis]
MNDRINEEIDQPVIVSGLISGMSIGTWQEDYHLTGRDYEHLKNGKPVTFNWANSILLTSIGIGLTLLGKYISQQTNPSVVIYKGEWIGLGIGIAISIILYVIGLCLPDDRKKLMRKLKDHFDNSPKMRQMMKEGEK